MRVCFQAHVARHEVQTAARTVADVADACSVPNSRARIHNDGLNIEDHNPDLNSVSSQQRKTSTATLLLMQSAARSLQAGRGRGDRFRGKVS